MIKIESVVMSVLHHKVEGSEEHTAVKTIFQGGSGKVTFPSLVWDERQVPLEFQYPGPPQHRPGEMLTVLIAGMQDLKKAVTKPVATEPAADAPPTGGDVDLLPESGEGDQ